MKQEKIFNINDVEGNEGLNEDEEGNEGLNDDLINDSEILNDSDTKNSSSQDIFIFASGTTPKKRSQVFERKTNSELTMLFVDSKKKSKSFKPNSKSSDVLKSTSEDEEEDEEEEEEREEKKEKKNALQKKSKDGKDFDRDSSEEIDWEDDKDPPHKSKTYSNLEIFLPNKDSHPSNAHQSLTKPKALQQRNASSPKIKIISREEKKEGKSDSSIDFEDDSSEKQGDQNKKSGGIEGDTSSTFPSQKTEKEFEIPIKRNSSEEIDWSDDVEPPFKAQTILNLHSLSPTLSKQDNSNKQNAPQNEEKTEKGEKKEEKGGVTKIENNGDSKTNDQKENVKEKQNENGKIKKLEIPKLKIVEANTVASPKEGSKISQLNRLKELEKEMGKKQNSDLSTYTSYLHNFTQLVNELTPRNRSHSLATEESNHSPSIRGKILEEKKNLDPIITPQSITSSSPSKNNSLGITEPKKPEKQIEQKNIPLTPKNPNNHLILPNKKNSISKAVDKKEIVSRHFEKLKHIFDPAILQVVLHLDGDFLINIEKQFPKKLKKKVTQYIPANHGFDSLKKTNKKTNENIFDFSQVQLNINNNEEKSKIENIKLKNDIIFPQVINFPSVFNLNLDIEVSSPNEITATDSPEFFDFQSYLKDIRKTLANDWEKI